ncbi:protein serine/threonine kinase, putative [Entamoeba invadens IP1]|uniref:Protein serine/threonine kinase, putative n=1 Tax=Entamoeba invadens IP1 TaxID=370355 RepID=L7FKT9_ENTIV|nr:protein serine/threonine kinase, putative [Entamoeba invadens IP1]ELP87161.1 protein serine/threonine kinase, putative [Entamoeba invadens IP1]|eukprot:XP_004253932.1 protein serine/threonine kinase, putative [Entamoeba invadens IP1]
MYLTITLLTIAVISSYVWCDDSNGIISYGVFETCLKQGWLHLTDENEYDYFSFDFYCCINNTKTLANTGTYAQNYPKYFRFQGNMSNFKTFFIREYNPNTLYDFYEDSRYQPFFISFGCFNKEQVCRKEVYDDTKPIIGLELRSVSLFSDIDQRFDIWLRRNLTSIPYVHVDGLVSQTVNFNFSDMSAWESVYSGSRYLFSGSSQVDESRVTFTKRSSSDGWVAKAVCTRSNFKRIMLFKENEITGGVNINLCGCVPNNGNLTYSSNFTYPDCDYNSTYLDLDLSKLSGDSINYTLFVFEWNTIIISLQKSYTLTSNSTNSVLKLNSLVLDKDTSIFFRLPVEIITLEVNSPSQTYFDYGLTVDNIISSTNDMVLFYLKGLLEGSTNKLSVCGSRVYLSTSLNIPCNCEYKHGNFKSEKSFIMSDSDCKMYGYNYNWQLNLIINYTVYMTDQINIKWKLINFTSICVLDTNNGIYYINAMDVVVYDHLTMNINFNVYGKLVLNNNSHITVKSGLLSFKSESLGFFNLTTTNIDVMPLINVNGCSVLMNSTNELYTFDYKEFCIDVISFRYKPNWNANQLSLLRGGKLLRVCNSTDDHKTEVKCTLNRNNFYDYRNYKYYLYHCPLNETLCTVKVNTMNVTINDTFIGNLQQEVNVLNLTITTNYSTHFKDIKSGVLYINNKSVNGASVTLAQKVDKLFISSKYLFQPNSNNNTIHFSTFYNCKAYKTSINGDYMCVLCKQNMYLKDGMCFGIYVSCANISSSDTTQVCEQCNIKQEAYRNDCLDCPNNCKRCVNQKCVLCEDKYSYDSECNCVEINKTTTKVEFYTKQKVLKCSAGYYNTFDKCHKCSDHCLYCETFEFCLSCKNTHILNEKNECAPLPDGEIVIGEKFILCSDSYYSNNGTCVECSSKYGELCDVCDDKRCEKCSNLGVLDCDGSCIAFESSGCVSSPNTYCSGCQNHSNYISESNGVCSEISNCKIATSNGKCVSCNEGYYFTSNQTCVGLSSNQTENCDIINNNNGKCIRCASKHYLSDGTCLNCPNNCMTCINTTLCIECEGGFSVSSNCTCTTSTTQMENCKKMINRLFICAICDQKYFRNDKGQCQNWNQCIPYETLTNCETKTQNGCSQCSTGYYVKSQLCVSCNSTKSNCDKCNSVGVCTSCSPNYILINSECTIGSNVSQCIKVENSKCSTCKFWYAPSSDGTSCAKKAVWWVIFIGVFLIILVLFVVFMVTIFITLQILKKKKEHEKRKKTCLFTISKSNITFEKTDIPDVVVNINAIVFESNEDNKEISVNEESRELICVGNSGNNTIKVQFSTKENCYKYTIRTSPNIATILKGKAIEFELFLKPLCSCQIDDIIVLVSSNLKKGEISNMHINIKAKTQLSTRLDPDELEEEKKLGEGSFGIVYKGTFRSNTVAIKKMKQFTDDQKSLDEFEKEVAMLDKFRCDYIVHFYGAIFIPNKICLVTEFANYGSLQDLMKHKQSNEVDMQTRLKMMLDSAKGYLIFAHKWHLTQRHQTRQLSCVFIE